jgi:hypothetical protein
MKQFLVVVCSVVELAACAVPAQPPVGPLLSTNGRAVVITTTNDVPGRDLEILGMVRAYNSDCGQGIGIAALREYPLTEAVVGYHEQQSTSCSGGTFGGMPYTLCGEVCEGTAAEFVERTPMGKP